MNSLSGIELDSSEFVEVDPTGRYGRYNEILGKGASKTVYRAFDEYEGIEVAWNQVKLNDFLQSPEDLERLYCEIHLLSTLKHKNIMKFYTSWVDSDNRNINFVTEMFTSGTLRQYRMKHRRVNIRAVKHWCRQILKGLLYLHSHDPLVIHRDLKCDNIFINGNQGEVKIGDLGLAAILRKSYAAHCVGTPEFMAPEIYEEEYNELVDIYSFGMCILEMVTFEYPYSECNHPAQIYKKVVSGKKPEALYKVKDPEVRQFVEKCLVTVSQRLPAKELLKDPFLQFNEYGSDLRPLDYYSNYDEVRPHLRQPLYSNYQSSSSLIDCYSHYLGYEPDNELDCSTVEFEASEIELFICQEDGNMENLDLTIKGRRREDDGIFLRLRIADREGRIRNIYFPFDIDTDTGLSIAGEMVDELDMTGQHVNKIADMIDAEISNLVPDWKRGLEIGKEDNPTCVNASFCQNCASSNFRLDYVSSSNAGTKNLQVLQCSKHGCAAVHGRFEEIMYQVEGPEQYSREGAHAVKRQTDSIHYADIWAQRDAPNSSSPGLRDIHCNEAHNASGKSVLQNEEKIITVDNQNDSSATYSYSGDLPNGLLDDYENEIRQELRWLKAKYEMQLRELRDQQLGAKQKSSSSSPQHNTEHMKDSSISLHFVPKKKANGSCLEPFPFAKNFTSYFPVNSEKSCANVTNKTYSEAASESCSPEPLVTAKSFYAGDFLPQPLQRATSLPVDAIDFLNTVSNQPSARNLHT